MIKKFILAAAVAFGLAFGTDSPAVAQFQDQATFAGTGAGSGNAQTITVPNASSMNDLVGVLVKYIPSATNTASATVTVNSFSACTYRKPSTAGPIALTGNPAEVVTGQPIVFMYDGSFCNIISAVNDTLSVGASNLTNSALPFGVPVNAQINASVGSNNLTIAIKGNNGSDPSATNPVLLAFRDATIANGGPKFVSLQSALSFTINSGSTMGCVSTQACRLWVEVICSAGTECGGSGSDVIGLCAFNDLSGTNVASINESDLQTSQSGTNGGNSAQAYYCNISGVSSKAIRIVGYIDVTEASAGTWATGPTEVQLYSPAILTPTARRPLLYQIQEQQTSGTPSSNAPASGSWVTVVINTDLTNEIPGATRSTNVVSLPAGTYQVTASYDRGSTGNAGPAQLRFQNNTASTTLVTGLNTRNSNCDGANNASYCGGFLTLSGRFTLAATSNVELDVRTPSNQSAAAATSWGTEVYVDLQITKVR